MEIRLNKENKKRHIEVDSNDHQERKCYEAHGGNSDEEMLAAESAQEKEYDSSDIEEEEEMVAESLFLADKFRNLLKRVLQTLASEEDRAAQQRREAERRLEKPHLAPEAAGAASQQQQQQRVCTVASNACEGFPQYRRKTEWRSSGRRQSNTLKSLTHHRRQLEWHRSSSSGVAQQQREVKRRLEKPHLAPEPAGAAAQQQWVCAAVSNTCEGFSRHRRKIEWHSSSRRWSDALKSLTRHRRQLERRRSSSGCVQRRATPVKASPGGNVIQGLHLYLPVIGVDRKGDLYDLFQHKRGMNLQRRSWDQAETLTPEPDGEVEHDLQGLVGQHQFSGRVPLLCRLVIADSLSFLAEKNMNRLSNAIESSEADGRVQKYPSNIVMAEEENSHTNQEESLQKDNPGYTAPRTVLPSDAKMKEMLPYSLETSCAQDSSRFLENIDSSEEKDVTCLLINDNSAMEDISVVAEDACSNSVSDIVKKDLPGKTLNYGSNTQEILGFSALDSIDASKIFNVSKTRLSNYSRNFSSLNEDTLARVDNKSNTVPKSMYAAADDSSSDTESVVETTGLSSNSSLLLSACNDSLKAYKDVESDEEKVEICCQNHEQQHFSPKEVVTSFVETSYHPSECHSLGIVLQEESKVDIDSLAISNVKFPLEEQVFHSPSQVSPPRIDLMEHNNGISSIYKNSSLRRGERISLESREKLIETCETSRYDAQEMPLCATKTINGWESNLRDKNECDKKEQSTTESDLGIDCGSHVVDYPSASPKKGTTDLIQLTKPDSHPVDCTSQRTVNSPRSPLMTKPKDVSKVTTASDLSGKNEKTNAIPVSKGSNAKIQTSGQCKGITIPHSPSSFKKLHQENRGIPQKSIAETLSNNQRNKPGPKLKGLTIKSKSKTHSDSLSAATAKAGSTDQKQKSIPVQSSPRLLPKKVTSLHNLATHLEPLSRSLSMGSRIVQQEEQDKLLLAVPQESPLVMLNNDENTGKNNKDKSIDIIVLGDAEMSEQKEEQVPIQLDMNSKERSKIDDVDYQTREDSSQISANPQITTRDHCLSDKTENQRKGMSCLNHDGCGISPLDCDNIGPLKKEPSSVLSSPAQKEQPGQEIQRTFIEVRLSSSSSFTPSSLFPEMSLEKGEGGKKVINQLEDEVQNCSQETSEEVNIHGSLKPVTRTYSMPTHLSNHLREESSTIDAPTHHAHNILNNVSCEQHPHSDLGMLKIVHLNLMNDQNIQDEKEASNSIPKSNSQELSLPNDNSSRVVDKLKTCRRNYYYYELNWPHDPISSFSVKQRIKSFENLANFDRPTVKAIDIHSTSLSSKLPVGRRLSGGISAVSSNSVNDAVQALRRSLSSYCESEAPPSPRMTKSSTTAAIMHLQQKSPEDSKDDVQLEKNERCGTLGSPESLPLSSTHRKSRASGGHIRHTPLSRSKLRELRALSMPDLDKLCSEDFTTESKSSPFKTELEVPPRARSLGLPIESVLSLNDCSELSGLVMASGQHHSKESSPRNSSSGTPGSASDEDILQHDVSQNKMCSGKSWSISLDQLLVSNLDQEKLQLVLSLVTTKCDVHSLLQEAKAQAEHLDNEDSFLAPGALCCQLYTAGPQDMEEAIPVDVFHIEAALQSTFHLFASSLLPPRLDPRQTGLVALEVSEKSGDRMNKEDVYFVVLNKEEGSGLGFSVAGGVDLEQKSIIVHRVFSKGVASQEGIIHRGDLILSINGICLTGSVHGDVLNALHQARLHKYAVVVIKKERDGKKMSSCRSEKSPPTGQKLGAATLGTGPSGELSDAIYVELLKTSAGLGFSLDGGKASICGDRPLLIKRIFKGGAAEQDGKLAVGDEILAVGGKSLLGLMHYDAWNILKSVPEGPVQLLIRKHQSSA
ncbi:hypothetical protein JD844_008380 [Phrynosoma platyrhinos]|uniref:PDZ domain-containing protein n=1 Tax=Phrynosoma platyrhinos TaxID=52577 RepID=A0ABQ7TE01_PHRPL|nr:hypothetical protein JD844_008380 [Phrynosoma platyrhinos]